MAAKAKTQRDRADGPYDAHRYTGGDKKPFGNGYILQYAPTHPYAYVSGYVLEHRLVMERELGRFLLPKEVVHHKDDNRTNNSLENLHLFSSQSEHAKHHRQQDALLYNQEAIDMVKQAAADPGIPMSYLPMAPQTIRGICERYGIEWQSAGISHLTDEDVREALQGRTTEEAAALLYVHPQTLYNRFDHLLTKRKGPGFLDEHREELCKIAIEQGIPAAAKHFGTNRETIYHNLHRWGIAEKIETPGKRNLASKKDEVLRLIQEHGYAKATEMLGKSKNALREAVKRWSEQGDLPDEFAHLASPRKSQKLQPERIPSDLEQPLP